MQQIGTTEITETIENDLSRHAAIAAALEALVNSYLHGRNRPGSQAGTYVCVHRDDLQQIADLLACLPAVFAKAAAAVPDGALACTVAAHRRPRP